MGALEALVDAAVGLDKIDAALLDSAEVARAVMEKAEEAREFWVDYWESFDHPYSREHTHKSGYVEQPGDYSRSIKVKFLKTPEGLPMARVTAHDYKAAWIEYGSSRMPEFACRAATVSHFGGSNKTISA
jgi:hypothetical protein